MIRLLKVLFDGKKPVNVAETVGAVRVEPERRVLADKLKQIDQSYKKIDRETKRMKRAIDTALAIAMSTGGLK